ncbi:MAG: DUF1840 family protein [Halothiobacillus sp.]
MPQINPDEENFMMVTFTCRADFSITMSEKDAFSMLEIMGQDTIVPGSILEADVAEAFNRLKAAIDAKNSANPVKESDEKDILKGTEHLVQALVDLFAAAVKNQCNVTWFESSSLI